MKKTLSCLPIPIYFLFFRMDLQGRKDCAKFWKKIRRQKSPITATLFILVIILNGECSFLLQNERKAINNISMELDILSPIIYPVP